MSDKIQLKYDCPESLTGMPKTDCGFYCSSCDKEVHDFRGKSLATIDRIKSEGNGIHCGIFDANQIRTDVKSKFDSIFRVAFVAVFILGFNSSFLYSQGNCAAERSSLVSQQMESNTIQISGIIYNHKSKPVRGLVTYHFKNDLSIDLIANEKGEFIINLPADALGELLYLSFKYKGMYERFDSVYLVEPKTYFLEIHLNKVRKRRKPKRVHMMGKF